MYVQQFYVEDLGCASYLIGSETQGTAVVVDPERDVRPYLEAAHSLGLKITHIIETHLHADHVSGNIELAIHSGAEIYIHSAAQAQFPHRPLNDGDVLELGEVRLAVRHTPGHTPESVTLLVSDTQRAAEPWMALTGDLLFVGDVGRPDLVGPEVARGLAGELYDSLFGTILQLDDSLMVYPGHGGGSLCGRAIASVRSSTLGFERRFNPALSVNERGEFIEYMTNNLPEQPGNHRRIKAMNRRGAHPLGEILPRPLALSDAITHFQSGAALLDTRPVEEYMLMHVPGSVNLAANEQMSNRAGFVLPPEVSIVLLLNEAADYERVVYSLARVGYDHIAGYLVDGLQSWQAAGLPVTSGAVEDLTTAELVEMLKNGTAPAVVDVREPWEYAQGHIPGARLFPLGQLSERLAELDPQQPVVVVCQTGSRSQTGAAFLRQKGFVKVYNLSQGTLGWMRSGNELRREVEKPPAQ